MESWDRTGNIYSFRVQYKLLTCLKFKKAERYFNEEKLKWINKAHMLSWMPADQTGPKDEWTV
jgi:hypothetical protein